MVADLSMQLEKVARDAVRALEPYDAELARALRRDLNAMSGVAIGTREQPANRAMELESGLCYLLELVADATAGSSQSVRWSDARIAAIRRLVDRG